MLFYINATVLLVQDFVDLTSLVYADDSTLYIGTNTGHVTAWDTRQNNCFLHWEADSHEIGTHLEKILKILCQSCHKKANKQNETEKNTKTKKKENKF